MKDWPWIIRYLKAHGMGYYAIANELNRRAPYRQSIPTDWRQIQRYESGTQPIWDDGQALIEIYSEVAPDELSGPSHSSVSSSHGRA